MTVTATTKTVSQNDANKLDAYAFKYHIHPGDGGEGEQCRAQWKPGRQHRDFFLLRQVENGQDQVWER